MCRCVSPKYTSVGYSRPTAGEYGITFCAATAVDDAAAGSGVSAAGADWAGVGDSVGEHAARKKPLNAMAIRKHLTVISSSPSLIADQMESEHG